MCPPPKKSSFFSSRRSGQFSKLPVWESKAGEKSKNRAHHLTPIFPCTVFRRRKTGVHWLQDHGQSLRSARYCGLVGIAAGRQSLCYYTATTELELIFFLSIFPVRKIEGKRSAWIDRGKIPHTKRGGVWINFSSFHSHARTCSSFVHARKFFSPSKFKLGLLH